MGKRCWPFKWETGWAEFCIHGKQKSPKKSSLYDRCVLFTRPLITERGITRVWPVQDGSWNEDTWQTKIGVWPGTGGEQQTLKTFFKRFLVFSIIFGRANQKSYHLPSNRNFRNFLVNGKQSKWTNGEILGDC